jgi:phospholipid/cholesterol/gamma-HCH transport system substrate-binding protein
MQLQRSEIVTGLLVLATIAVVTFILIMLGAPGLFRPLVVYRLYFDNAAGIKLGAPVLLAGRKVGQVKSLNSPVSREEAAHALEAAGNLGSVTQTGPAGTSPLPRLEVRIDVEVDRAAFVYKNATVRLMTLGLLGETAIDISGGNDRSGRAQPGQVFAGNRVPDFSEAVTRLLTIVQPVATQATATFKELQNTTANLSKITDQNSPFTLALEEFKTFGEHINELTDEESSLAESLKNIRDISEQLTRNDNIKVTLENFRSSSEKLKSTLNDLGPDLQLTIRNARDLTDTLRSQPWRLVYPTTKKYPQPEATPTPARRSTKVKSRRASP